MYDGQRVHCLRAPTLSLRFTSAQNALCVGASECWEVPEVISIDLETTGFSPDKDRIFEIGAVSSDGSVFQQFIKVDVPKHIQALTHVTQAEVDHSGVSLYEACHAFKAWLDARSPDAVWAGHRFRVFDFKFLLRAFKDSGFAAPVVPRGGLIDTCEWAAALKLPKKSLGAMFSLAFNGQELTGAHRATTDADAVLQILFSRWANLKWWKSAVKPIVPVNKKRKEMASQSSASVPAVADAVPQGVAQGVVDIVPQPAPQPDEEKASAQALRPSWYQVPADCEALLRHVRTVFIIITSEITPDVLKIVEEAEEALGKQHPAKIVIKLLGANDFNNTFTSLFPRLLDGESRMFRCKVNSSPHNSAIINEFARRANIQLLDRGDLNWTWLLTKSNPFQSLPLEVQDTTPAKILNGLWLIFEQTQAQFPSHCDPSSQDFDTATAKQLEAMHNFQQAHVKDLFINNGLPPPSFLDFIKLLDYNSGFWDALYVGDNKKHVQDKCLRHGLRAAVIPMKPTPALACDMLETTVPLLVVWLFNHDLISQEFYSECMHAILGKAGMDGTLLTRVMDAFPSDQSMIEALRDIGDSTEILIVDDEADDFAQAALLSTYSTKPLKVVHTVARNLVYNDQEGLDVKALVKSVLPNCDHEFVESKFCVRNVDKVWKAVESHVGKHAKEEAGPVREAALTVSRKRVKAAEEVEKVAFAQFKKAKTAENYTKAVDSFWLAL